jgi:hypothetical protein
VLADLAGLVRQLHCALVELQRETACLSLESLSNSEWFEILERKLLPQLGEDAWLVVAVTGGTNIGKSVVFNHLAGFRASATSPLASGTRHPVCLAPTGFETRHDLATIFPGFSVQPWTSADDALKDGERDFLFWRTSPQVPENLLLLDTPDIDSDAPVNWRRADAIRQAADVLIAVLTQQKYNDAAVKQFFRKAAEDDAAVIVVFNQCELPEDEAYWPLWCRTFCDETGLKPEWIYVAPNDRKRAEALKLPFYERHVPEASDPRSTIDRHPNAEERPLPPPSLQETLSRLRFEEIKLRTLRGALLHLAGPKGAEAYLAEIRLASGEYRSAAELLTAQRLAEVDHWPTPPTSLLIKSIQEWWAQQRAGWPGMVHALYNTVGDWLMTPVRSVNTWLSGPTEPPWAAYQRAEWNAVVRTVEKVFERLEWLSQLGHELLRRHLEPVLAGTARGDFLERLAREHGEVDFSRELERLVGAELETFRRENPNYFQFFQRLDAAAAAARPGLTVALSLTGIGLPFGEAATHLASHAVWQTALHVVGDVAGGTMAAAIGDTAISSTAASGVAYLQARFHRLQAAFTTSRVAWLAERMERNLLRPTTQHLARAVAAPQTPAFQQVEASLKEIRGALERSGCTLREYLLSTGENGHAETANFNHSESLRG